MRMPWSSSFWNPDGSHGYAFRAATVLRGLQTGEPQTGPTRAVPAGGASQPPLPTIDECQFYRLLEGPGRVRVEVVRLGRYFAPFVTFLACEDAPWVRYGAIVRGAHDLLAAETVEGVLDLIHELVGHAGALQIPPYQEADCAP